MTDRQLEALQSYVCAVVRIMTNHASAHAQNVRLILDSKRELEAAFGQELPGGYPDLFAEVPAPQPPAMPDLL